MEQGLNDDDWITKQAIYMYRKVDPFLHKHPKKKGNLKKVNPKNIGSWYCGVMNKINVSLFTQYQPLSKTKDPLLHLSLYRHAGQCHWWRQVSAVLLSSRLLHNIFLIPLLWLMRFQPDFPWIPSLLSCMDTFKCWNPILVWGILFGTTQRIHGISIMCRKVSISTYL